MILLFSLSLNEVCREKRLGLLKCLIQFAEAFLLFCTCTARGS